MTRRTRFTAGILALLALAFSFAESVWASTCTPMSPMAMSAGVEETPPGAPEALNCLRYSEGDSAPGEQERPCPFSSPVAAQACAGVASLPAGIVSLPARPSEGAAERFMLDIRSDLLLGTALFRPPRA